MCATHVRARVKMTKLCRLCPAPHSAASDRYADTRRYFQAAAAVCQNAQQKQKEESHMQTAAEWHGKCLAQCKVSERYKNESEHDASCVQLPVQRKCHLRTITSTTTRTTTATGSAAKISA